MHLLDRSSKRKNISTATVVLEGSSQIPLASPRSRGLASAAIARSRSPDSSRTQAITDNETSVMMAERMNARSEEHTSELQSLMRISYAVFCLKTQNTIVITVALITTH